MKRNENLSEKLVRLYNEYNHAPSGLEGEDLYTLDESEVDEFDIWVKDYKQQVYDYHHELHTNDRGVGGSIHKRVREAFELTSNEVVIIIDEMKIIKPVKT